MTSEAAGTPSGVSITRFSTTPSSVTMTIRVRPGPSATNSRCFSGLSVLGATTRPVQPDRPERTEVASLSISRQAIGRPPTRGR